MLWTATTVSQLAVRLGGIAVSLLAVTSLAATPFQMGLLVTAQTLGVLIIGLPAGVIVDRVSRRRLMVRMDAGRALLVASIPIAWWTGLLSWPYLLTVALATSLASVFFDVAQQAYLPTVVARPDLIRANTRLQATYSVVGLGGATVGGVLVSLTGAPGAVLVAAIVYVASAGALRLMRDPDALPTEPRRGLVAEARDGFGYVWRDGALRAIAFCTATANLFMSMVVAVLVLFVVRNLRIPTYAAGLVVAAAGVGGLIAAATTRRWVARLGQPRTVVLSLLVTQPFALLAPLARPGAAAGLFVLSWFVLGYGSTLYNIAQVSYRQAVCPDNMLGRVNAANRFLAWGTPPIGGLLAGVLAEDLGLRTTLWIAAIGLLAGVGWLLGSPLWRRAEHVTAIG